MLSVDEITEILKRDSMKDAVLIGTEDNRKNYYPAIIDCDEKKGIVTYDYELLARCFADEFFDPSDPSVSYEQAMSDAYEWVDYNIIRGIPYLGEHAPIIHTNEED